MSRQKRFFGHRSRTNTPGETAKRTPVETTTTAAETDNFTTRLDHRDRLFRQLRDGKELLDCAAIDDEEYRKQRSAILQELEKHNQADQ